MGGNRAIAGARPVSKTTRRHSLLTISLLTGLWASAAWGLFPANLSSICVTTASPGAVDSGYTMGNTDHTTTLVVPYLSSDAYIAITNLDGLPQTVTLEYRNLAGMDRTPATNTHVLPAGGTVRWAPLKNDPATEGVEGSGLPDMTGDATAGSAIITGQQALAGILELQSSDGSWSSFLLSGLDEAGTTLIVPSFGTASLIAIKNLGTAEANVALSYQGPSEPAQNPAPFQLPAGAAVRWGPLLSDVDLEGAAGAAIPDMTGGFSWGNVTIVSDQLLAGQVQLDHAGPGRGHTLAGRSSPGVVVPYFYAPSLIALHNAGAAAANVFVFYRDLESATTGSESFMIAVNQTRSFMPNPDDGGIGSGHWNADIAADQPLAGQLESLEPGGGTRAYRLRGTDESSQVLTVPYFRKGTYFAVQNVGTSAGAVSVTYRDLSGTDRTPALATFELGAGESARWSPFPEAGKKPEFKADGLPSITGDVGEGSAIITGSQWLVGQVELGKAFEPEDVNQDGTVNAVDIQLVVNAALAIPVAYNCDVNGDAEVNAIDIQLIINRALVL